MRRYSTPVLKLCLPRMIDRWFWTWYWVSVKYCGRPADNPNPTVIGSYQVAIEGIPRVPGGAGKSDLCRR